MPKSDNFDRVAQINKKYLVSHIHMNIYFDWIFHLKLINNRINTLSKSYFKPLTQLMAGQVVVAVPIVVGLHFPHRSIKT